MDAWNLEIERLQNKNGLQGNPDPGLPARSPLLLFLLFVLSLQGKVSFSFSSHYLCWGVNVSLYLYLLCLSLDVTAGFLWAGLLPRHPFVLYHRQRHSSSLFGGKTSLMNV